MGKTHQSPSLVLVKPKKDMNNVSCRRDMTNMVESDVKRHSINQSIAAHLVILHVRTSFTATTTHETNREYVYSVAVYQKYLTRFGELIIFELWRENYHFAKPI